MNVQNLLNQFIGTGKPNLRSGNSFGGLAGGAAAGGVMALLVGNKKARKFAGKAATVGGAAVLGGLAFSAYKNWQQSKANDQPSSLRQSFSQHFAQQSTQPELPDSFTPAFELSLIKTMISAANADGHIDEQEQERILAVLEERQYDETMKATIMDLVRYPLEPEALANETKDMEQRSEMYLMACFTIDIDTPEERQYLIRLANALQLPAGLTAQLEQQALELTEQAA